MTILIACDSFKDALPAMAVCEAIARGLQIAIAPPQTLNCLIFPLADGGEGTFDVLTFHKGLEKKTVRVQDPLFRKINAHYGISRDGRTAFIEMASAAGLQLLVGAERNPLKTSTYGVGELILAALTEGVENIALAIGGSATNDGGVGMAAALGYQFLDEAGHILEPIGGHLGRIHHIVKTNRVPDFSKVKVEVICDVKNPLLGEKGAAQVYARQKGATDAMIEALERGMRQFADCAAASSIFNRRIASDTEGGGAAGGLGYGSQVFLNARLRRGIDMILDMTDFEQVLKTADILITGEGRLDSQTAQGKLIDGLCQRAKKFDKPVIALCGAVDAPPQYIHDLGLTAAFSIAHKPTTLSEALATTAENLEKTAFAVGQVLSMKYEV
jgi:glycerate kinase